MLCSIVQRGESVDDLYVLLCGLGDRTVAYAHCLCAFNGTENVTLLIVNVFFVQYVTKRWGEAWK